MKDYGKLPLSFIQNNGQMNEKVKFYEKGNGHTTFFTKEGMTLVLTNSSSKKEGKRSEVIRLTPLGANQDPEIVAEGKQEGTVNYFIGKDPANWKRGIPTYEAVLYKELYQYIDMRIYGNNRQFEYDVIVKPGANPSKVRFAYEGISGLRITEAGELEIALKEGTLIQNKPYIYQEIDGNRVEVEGKFVLLDQQDKPPFAFGFEVASYNKAHTLIIDPVLVYSTFISGGSNNNSQEIAVDSFGNVYITGVVTTNGFSTVSPIQGSLAGGAGDEDAFITKINASGTALVYSTYLGGSQDDVGYGIAVDDLGNAYITGQSFSIDFPTSSPIQGSNAGGSDAFVTKINTSGTALVYSTYLGGEKDDIGDGVALDGAGNAYISGGTESGDFPTASPIQVSNGGKANREFRVMSDAFVTKINATGTSLVYSTYLGGNGSDGGSPGGPGRVRNDGPKIAVDSAGNAYITGTTISSSDPFGPIRYPSNFPTVSPIQENRGGPSDAFLAKINASGTAFVYSTYLGGTGNDQGYNIAVDDSGSAYVIGITISSDFPTVAALQETKASSGRSSDIFITKVNPTGTAFVYSTYLGGGGRNSRGGFVSNLGFAIAVDSLGNVYVTGMTGSTAFPVKSSIQSSHGGGNWDAFVSKINTTGALVYSTYLGGSHSTDQGSGIAVDDLGNAYVTGWTGSPDFPLLSPLSSIQAGNTPFVVKISDAAAIPDIAVTPLNHDFGNVTIGNTSKKIFSLSNNGNVDLVIGTIAQANGLLLPFSLVVSQDNCSNQTLTASSSCTFEVQFGPSTATTSNDIFDIPSNDSNENTVNISVSGTGVVSPVPDITVTPLTLAFGNITEGNTLEQTVTIKNDGNANLVIGTISGANAAHFGLLNDSCSGQTVVSLANCTFDIRFAPTGTGVFTDSFTVPSNDTDENSVSVSVSGTGLSSSTTNPPSAPELVFPANGESVSGPDVTFGFNRASDPDGDAIGYTINVCEDVNLTNGCIPNNVVASVNKKGVDYAELSLGLGLLFGFVLIGRPGSRKKIGLMMAVMMVSGLLLVSCGGGSDNNNNNGGGGNPTPDLTHTVTGLKTGTTYHWQVVADDGNGGITKSEKRNFSTQ